MAVNAGSEESERNSEVCSLNKGISDYENYTNAFANVRH